MTADVRHAGRAALLSAALRYAEMGWNVFPCWWINADRNCACGVACKSPGKHPIAALVPHGQDNASTEPKIIKGWWQRFPDANIGVAMSRNGLVAIDVDPRNGGLETVDALRERHGSLESDVQQITGGGGDHYIYRAPEGVTLPGKLGPGVDVKHHGYIMAWPSNHISGSLYQWEASSDPTEGMVAPPLPDWISALAAVPVASMAAIQTHRHIDEVTAGELASALEVTPSDDRDTWVRVMMALRQSGQQGWDLWDGWSRKSSKYDPADSRRVWHTARPRGEINYESIFTLAESHGWVNPAKVPKPTPEQKTARRADLLRLVRDSDAKAPPKVKARQQITVAPLPNDSLQGVLNWISLSYPQSHPLVSAGAVLAVLATAAWAGLLHRRSSTIRSRMVVQ